MPICNGCCGRKPDVIVDDLSVVVRTRLVFTADQIAGVCVARRSDMPACILPAAQ
ncbi:hypothetical protein ACIA5C_23690 [Actinoplanes sp. NPDC051343]|uniref:hypothetical protein n=1 Tax=Actinoplanes sp. NPDC051343 TaxID=3363906 RepID=UPI0037959525